MTTASCWRGSAWSGAGSCAIETKPASLPTLPVRRFHVLGVLRSDYRRLAVSGSTLVLGPVRDTGSGHRTLEETGLTSSTAFTVKPEKVARPVVRAIEKDKASSSSCRVRGA